MNIELLHQNVQTNKAHEIGDLASELSWETDIDDQPGKFNIELINKDGLRFDEGDIVRYKFNGKNIFFGRVFKKGISNGKASLMAYDNKRYLKNEDTIVFKATTSDQRFVQICKMQGLAHRIRDKSGYKLPPAVYDQQSYYSMIENSLDLTLVNYGMWYIVRDNFGTLEHVALNSLITDIVIGDESLATEYEYESSIDDSYNIVKLTKDNEETNRRDVYLVHDSNLERRWGPLQFHQSISEDLNPAQIKEQANNILKSKRRPERTLSISCLGHPDVFAGVAVVIQFKDLANEGYDKPKLAIVRHAKHTWGTSYIMDLDLVVI